MLSRVLAALAVVVVTGVIGCGSDSPPAADGEGSIDRAQVSALVRSMAAAQDSLFALPAATAPYAQCIHEYWEYRQALKNRELRDAALDSFWVRWDRDPENFLWIELAHIRKAYFRDDQRREDALRRASGPDSTSVVARWVYGRGRLTRSPDRLEYMYSVEEAGGTPTEMQAAWLQLMLGRVDQLIGKPEAAAERMAPLLTRAWVVGGLPFVSNVWHDLSMYSKVQGRLDDALFAADMAVECASRDRHAILLIRALLVRGAALEARCEYPAAARSYHDAQQLATENSYLKWLHDSIHFTIRTNRAQGEWRTCVDNQRHALDLALEMSDTLSAIHVCLDIGNSYQHLGGLDSTRIWLARAEELNRAGTPRGQEDSIARYRLNFLLQIGQYSRADSLRATMSEQLNEFVTFGLLMEMVEQGLETGRPDLAQRGLARARTLESALIKTDRYDPVLHLSQLAAVFHARLGEFARADVELAIAQARIEAGATEYARWDQAFRVGEVAELSGDLVRATEAFSEALENALDLEASDLAHRSRIRLGHVLLNRQQYRQARDLFSDSTEVEEYWPKLSARLFLGLVENRAGNHREAYEHLTGAERLLQPDAPRDLAHRLHLERGHSLSALGQPREALAAYRRLDFSPTSGGGTLIANKLLQAFNRPYHLEYAEAVIGLLHDHPHLCEGGNLALETLAIAESARWNADPLGPPPEIDNLATIPIPAGAVVAVFFPGQAASFAWYGSADGWSLHRIADHERLTALIENTLIDMESPQRQVDWSGAGELARLLLGPVEAVWEAETPLYVIAPGRLSSLPWPALPLGGAAGERMTRVNDHGPVVHLSDLTALRLDSSQPRDPRRSRMLALGIDGKASDHLLHHAETEARSVATLWPETGIDLRCGPSASWQTVAEGDLTSFDIIHLATHTRITQGIPGHSSLRMSGEDKRPLTIPDISQLELAAEFVFLSSCDGARSTSGQTGGINSFVRAFLVGGARSVLSSTHAVDDRAAKYLAERFYTHWLAGKSKAASLRAAQLDIQNADDAWQHPFYWGHYQLHVARW